MADTLVQNIPYWSDDGTGVIVFLDSEGNVLFARTVDKGISWSGAEIVDG